MLTQKEIKITLKQGSELAVFLERIAMDDDKMSFFCRINLLVLKKHRDDYQDGISDATFDHALEKDGKLIKDDKGNYEFSRSGRKALEKDTRELGRKEISVKLHLFHIGKDKKESVFNKLPMAIKSMFEDKLLTFDDEI